MLIDLTTELMSRKPADYKFGGNCGVLSVAICAGVSFEEAKAACHLRKGSKGGTGWLQREQALQSLGVTFESKTLHPAKTVRVFARDWAVPGVTYMLRVKGHVVTLLNGIVMDQGEVAPAVVHKCRNSRVTRATKILARIS